MRLRFVYYEIISGTADRTQPNKQTHHVRSQERHNIACRMRRSFFRLRSGLAFGFKNCRQLAITIKSAGKIIINNPDTESVESTLMPNFLK